MHFNIACPTVTVGDFEACIRAMVDKRGCVAMKACDALGSFCQPRDL